MELDYSAIGKRIKTARAKRGLTQEKLAEYAHLSTSYIGKIETGDSKLSLQTIVSIAEALHTSVDALLADHVVYPDVYLKKSFEELLDGLSMNEMKIIEDTLSALRTSLIHRRRVD